MTRKKRSRTIGLIAGLFLAVLLSLFLFKDRLAYYLVKINFEKSFKNCSFSAGDFRIGLDRLEARHVEIRSKPPLKFNVKDAGVSLKFAGFAVFKDPLGALREAHISVKLVEFQGLACQDLSLGISGPAGGSAKSGTLKIGQLGYNEAKVKGIEADFVIRPASVTLENAGASVFNGRISASGLLLSEGRAWGLTLKIQLQHIAVEELLKALKLEKRIEAGGIYSGPLEASFKNGRLEALEGKLKSEAGGRFVITDTSLLNKDFLKTDAANIVVENLRNYYYDIGNVKVRNAGNDIRIGVLLNGPLGKRDLEIIWHREEITKW